MYSKICCGQEWRQYVNKKKVMINVKAFKKQRVREQRSEYGKKVIFCQAKKLKQQYKDNSTSRVINSSRRSVALSENIIYITWHYAWISFQKLGYNCNTVHKITIKNDEWQIKEFSSTMIKE